MKLGIIAVLVLASTRAHAGVTVFMERDGFTTDAGVVIPGFGGSDHVWNGVVGCVKEQFEPFAVDIVDQRPSSGTYITAVIGGRAAQLGYDDDSTAGVSPYNGALIDGAVVHVFSQSAGETNAARLCAGTAHEIGHALGLDHTHYCGDIMSYYGDACGPQTFLDAYMACGEKSSRTCGDGAPGQSSYARIVAAVGLRARTPHSAEPAAPTTDDVDVGDIDDGDGEDEDGVDWGSTEEDDGDSAAQEAQPAAEAEPRTERHRWRHRRARVYMWWYFSGR